MLEVDNLLQGWPVYVINFTPKDTTPHKIILHLKNPTRYIIVEPDNDSDDDEDPGNHLDEYRMLINNSDTSIMVSTIPCCNRSLQYESAEDSSDDKTSSGEKTLLTNIKAILVSLASIPEEPVSTKCKIFDKDWPSCHPHAYCRIPADGSIRSYEAFMTWPEVVKPIKDAGSSLDRDKIDSGDPTMKN
ncbi:hypothetical protein J3A83DRAFT_4184882 [Scleroderma citrinum]